MSEAIIVSKYTGEVLEEGVFRTHEQMKASRDFFQSKISKSFKLNEEYKSYGNFVWFLYNTNKMLELGIKPENLTRLIFISTYMDYSNRLMLTQRVAIDKNTMYSLLGISDRLFRSFYKEMVETNIFIEKENGIYLNKTIFSKGDISKTNISKQKIRLYANGIRDIYAKANIREHKLLSYFFQAIPYINLQYNIICHNILEPDRKFVNKMTVLEFCTIIGYEHINATRLCNSLMKVTIDDEYVFNIVKNGSGLSMFINPSVYYAGDIWNEVKILGDFTIKN